jgi:hypothetical protein
MAKTTMLVLSQVTVLPVTTLAANETAARVSVNTPLATPMSNTYATNRETNPA